MSVREPLLSAEEGQANLTWPFNNYGQNLENSDDDAPSCRICFEHKTQIPNDDLFLPCRCIDPVHRSCLNQWRVTDGNPEAFTKCPSCNWSYQTHVIPPSRTICYKLNNFLARHSFFFFTMNTAIIILGGYALSCLDKQEILVQKVHEWIEIYGYWGKHQPPYPNIYIYYWVFMANIYIAISLLFWLVNLAFMRNRLIYLRHMLGRAWICGIFRILLLLFLTSLVWLFSPLFGVLVLTIQLQVILSLHYQYIDRLHQARNFEIKSYHRNQDPDLPDRPARPAQPARFTRTARPSDDEPRPLAPIPNDLSLYDYPITNPLPIIGRQETRTSPNAVGFISDFDSEPVPMCDLHRPSPERPGLIHQINFQNQYNQSNQISRSPTTFSHSPNSPFRIYQNDDQS